MPEQYGPERLPGARGGIVVIEGETTIKNDHNSANESMAKPDVSILVLEGSLRDNRMS